MALQRNKGWSVDEVGPRDPGAVSLEDHITVSETRFRDVASTVSGRAAGALFDTSKEKLRFQLYALLMAVDLLCVGTAIAMGSLIRLGDPLHPQGRDMLVLMMPVFLGLAIDLRAYSIETLAQPRKGMARACQALVIAFAIVMGFMFYMKVGAHYSRLALAIGTIGSIGLVVSMRYLVGHALGRAYQWSFVNEVLLVDGVPVQPKAGEIVIFADREALQPTMEDPVMLDRVGRFLVHCDRVILACPPERRLRWSRMLKGMDVDAEVLAPEIDAIGALAMRSSHGRRTLLVSCGPLGFRARLIKRCLDLAIAIPALILLSPLMLVTALAIKLESPGPALFLQPRVGRGNRIFNMLKFRSMRIEATDHAGVRSARRNDDRLTRVGAVIRKSSIDELPQLINVLRGDMSIVGPRPHALASTAGERLFWAVDNRYLERHIVKPGITGLAQVRGFRGATVTESDLINRLQSDLDYLSGWNIWRDVKILLNTFLVLVHDRAY